MLFKIIKYQEIILNQGDIDYLKQRANECLKKYFDENNWIERTHYFFLFQAYWDLYLDNKDKVGKIVK